MSSALDDLVDDMAALLDAPCTLEDPHFQLIGFSGQREVGTVRQRSILERCSTQDVKDWFVAQGEHGTGLDLDDGESRLRLHLALRISSSLGTRGRTALDAYREVTVEPES